MDLGLKALRGLVTGGSSGLGKATAMLLAHEGARVAINSRDESRLGEAAQEIKAASGGNVFTAVGDVSDPATPEKIVNEAATAMGGLDILVTNSGGPPTGAFADLEDQAWLQAIDLLFNSHRRLILAALPFLRKSQAASVLTITSISVKQPISNLILSNTIRAATVALTKSLSQELAPSGIRFNSILPGWTETDRVHDLLESRAKANKRSKEEEIESQSKATPLGRMGRPEEFANAAVFLLSPAASYLNGVMLPVDGGLYNGLF
ncbi:MAG: SDR family oxidoreductase [Chloroflexi bacterium]|nr:SDR family oxidoreductase [Chloroflexota bacterium]